MHLVGSQRRAHLRLLIGLVFACSALSTPPVEAAQPPPKDCGLKQYASLDLQVGDNVYVPVSIDGHAGYMSLDLGSAISVLNNHTVTTLGLKTRRLPADVYINETKATQSAEFKMLALGAAKFGKSAFLADPRVQNPESVVGQPLFGTLGTEIFRVVDFELDLARKKLNLFSQDHCRGNVVYWSDSAAAAPLYLGEVGTLYFPIELEGKKIEATLAPSNATTTLTTDVTQRLFGFDKSSPGIEVAESKDKDDDGPTAHYRAMRLTAPGLTVKDTPIRLTDRHKVGGCSLETRGRRSGGVGYAGCYNVYPMTLGRNILAKIRLYFATKEKMLYFTASDAGFSGTAVAQ